MKDPSFIVVLDGPKGSHSIRKAATFEARKLGCSKDEVDHRARWKSGTRQQDAYTETTIPTIEAKVASKLCKGGAIYYHLKADSKITNDWILTHVVPLINAKYGPSIANVLGRALLWRIFDPEQSKVVNLRVVSRVKAAYCVVFSYNCLDEGENPVAKIPITLSEIDGEVSIEPFFTDEELAEFEDEADNVNNNNNNNNNNNINNNKASTEGRRRRRQFDRNDISRRERSQQSSEK